MSSPVYYIVVALMLASFTLSAIFYLAWKTLGEKPHAMSWSVGFLAAGFQWLANLQRDLFPSHEVYWLTVNALAMVLITLGIRGHCQRTDCQILPKNLWPYAAACYALIVWATVFKVHVGISMAVVPAAAALTLFLSALMIVKHREVTRPGEWAAAISMILFAASQGIAAGMAGLQGAAGDPGYLGLYVHFNFLTLPSGYMATSMFVLFMLASDLSAEMKEIAVRDQLTGCLNRRGLGECGSAAYASARRNDRPVSVIMTDIDRFKSINDEFGHSVGDTALVHFARLLKVGRRADDILARVGGEEFALIMQGSDLNNAIKVADHLCVQIAENPMLIDGRKLPMTASFGVATLSDKDTCLSDVVARADRALYRSKRAGRNQVDLESSQMMRATDGTLKPLTT